MFKLGQETVAIVTVGLALATIVVTGDNGIRSDMQAMRAEARAEREAIRAEARAEREAIRAEARADREAWQAESVRLRAEDRASLEAWQKERDRLHDEARADREAWQAEARPARGGGGRPGSARPAHRQQEIIFATLLNSQDPDLARYGPLRFSGHTRARMPLRGPLSRRPPGFTSPYA